MILSDFFKIVLFVILVCSGIAFNVLFVIYVREQHKYYENSKALAKLAQYFKLDKHK